MPSGPDETHAHENTSMTEQAAENASSKTDTTASDHPKHKVEGPIGDKVDIRHHQANPGPVIHQDLKNIPQEGSKEERRMKMEEMNK